MKTIIDPNFYQEEIRCNYLVTREQKKIWAVELELLSIFDTICKKYDLTYFADYGTLLGAVRHQGFIPWDDDIDVCMFRPDYEKLKSILIHELKKPYFFQNAYTDNILFSFSKIRDSRTTAIERQYCKNNTPNQGIFIDIFPLDGIYPCDENNILAIEREIWASIVNPDLIIKMIHTAAYPTALTRDILQELLSLPIQDRMKEFENFLADQFESAPYIGLFTDLLQKKMYRQKSWYDQTIYLPFEHLMIPAPSAYDQVLTSYYGDYHQLIQGKSDHEHILMDPERSYLEYYQEWGIL